MLFALFFNVRSPNDRTIRRRTNFAKLKGWLRIATRYDPSAHAFFSAVCVAGAVAFYLNQ